MQYGLIGERLGHSYSPMIHARLGDYRYELLEIPPCGLDAFLRARSFRGLNVTIPYKRAVIPYCDALGENARAIGSVNTLVVRPDGTLLGDNTDIDGFMQMLVSADIDPRRRKVAVLGSGGTSLTACAALKRMGAKETIVVSRCGPIDYAALYASHADVQILVNATPVGMYPNNGVSPVDLSRLPAVEGVADVVYNPERTALILDAQSRGLRVATGLTMLVAQAWRAAELFTGKSISPEIDASIRGDILDRTLSLVLVGMPGCGKSTLGSMVARRMNRPFVDVDALVARRAGMNIPEIFHRHGEEAFRDMESKALEDVGKVGGQVIACGGGAILRERNVRALRQNARVCLIRRPLNALARDGRPLSTGDDAVERLWLARRERYESCADFSIDNTGTPESAAQRIEEGFHEAAHH